MMYCIQYAHIPTNVDLNAWFKNRLVVQNTMKVRVLWTGDVIDLSVPRSPFEALECSQGNNLKIKSTTGAEALRDQQWRDAAWIRLNHAGKCSKWGRERVKSFLYLISHSRWHHRCIITPQNNFLRECSKNRFWEIIVLSLRNQYVFLQPRSKLSKYRSHQLL